MKINLNNKNIIRKVATKEPDLCSSCYFTKCHIDCFEAIYNRLHGCFLTLSYYDESNSNDSLFKL